MLDLGNITLDGTTGDITLAGDINLSNGNITWGDNSPTKYQFSVDGTSNWYTVMGSSDKYRRDSLDGGVTWGSAYQFVGIDGNDGSDANVPGYIKSTYIDSSTIKSPIIEGNRIEARIPDIPTLDNQGFVVSGLWGGEYKDMLQISYYDSGGAPYVTFGSSSPFEASAEWSFNDTNFSGNVNFTGNATGVVARFA